MHAALKLVDWLCISVEESWNQFTEIIKKVEENYIPLKTYHSNRIRKLTYLLHD